MRLVTRKQWNAISTRPSPDNITPEFGGVAIHYLGGKGKATPSSHAKCAGIVQGIQKYHVNSNGWIQIAYSFLVCQHGYVYEGRGLGKRTAANGTTSGNQNYYAVCGLINDLDSPSKEMLQGIYEACQYLRTKGRAGDKVVGHRNFLSTSCPGPLYKHVQSGRFHRPKVAVDNSFPGNLKRGDFNPSVGKLQERLTQLGFPTKKDNDFGKNTEISVRKFEVANRLTVNGIVDKKDWDHLF